MPKKFTFHLSLHYQKNYTTNAPLLPTIKTKNQRTLNKTKNCILFILSTKKNTEIFEKSPYSMQIGSPYRNNPNHCKSEFVFLYEKNLLLNLTIFQLTKL